MAFFKFRKSGGEVSAPDAPVPSVEAIRQRAKYRLVGATVLILLAVVGLPMLFDKQPRPISVDTPIEIPDKNKVLPLIIPAAAPVVPAAALAPASATPASPASPASPAGPAAAPSPKIDLPAKTELVIPAPVAAKADAAPAKTSDGLADKAPTENRAQALLDGKDVANPVAAKPSAGDAQTARFVVQVGAFADDAHARVVRVKVEKAGLKTYTQVADTKDGRRIRVRVGPYASRVEAEKAAAKLKKLDLPAALLTL